MLIFSMLKSFETRYGHMPLRTAVIKQGVRQVRPGSNSIEILHPVLIQPFLSQHYSIQNSLDSTQG